MNKLQLALFSESREGIFRDFAVANPAAYETKEKLSDFLRQLSTDQLIRIAAKFQFLPIEKTDGGSEPFSSAAKKRKVDQELSPPSFPPKFSDKLFEKDVIIKVIIFRSFI